MRKTKISLILLSAIFMFAGGMFLTSCDKEESIIDEGNDEVLERILDFKEKVESPNQQKSGEEISVEDAVWLVEAALNYSYCIKTEEQANAGTNVIVVDSLFYEVSSSNNNVNFADAINTYLTIETDMAEMLASYQSEVKFYDVVDVEYKDGSFVAYVAIRYKEGMEKSTNGLTYPFTIRHDWYWGYSLGFSPWRAGKCDGTYQGRDAVTEIGKWITVRKGVYANVYYTDIYFVGLFNTASSYNENGTNLSSFGVDMFSVDVDAVFNDPWAIATHVCLSASESTYYAQQCQSALNVIENNFINAGEDITYNLLNGYTYNDVDGQPPTNLYHMYVIQAGTRHYGGPSWER